MKTNTGYRSRWVNLAALYLIVAVGCGAGAGLGGGPPQSGQCPTLISAAQGANNSFAMFNGFLTGDFSGPDGSAIYSTVCVRLADVPQTLAIKVMGAKPSVGIIYGVTNIRATGNVAIVEYAEGNNGTKVWIGTSGAVKIDSVAREIIGLSFTQVIVTPEAGKPNNTATGTLTLSGLQQANDVLGFVP
jgi:hypothetical protein